MSGRSVPLMLRLHRFSFSFVALTSAICGSVRAFGALSGVIGWQPHVDGPRYVMPLILDETPSATAARWQRTLKASSVYGRMQGASQLNLSVDKSGFSPIPQATYEHPNVGSVLNRPNQIANPNAYWSRVAARFERKGVRLFGVPVGIEEVLQPDEFADYVRILRRMNGQIGVGGDDPDPTIYLPPGSPEAIAAQALTKGDVSAARDRTQILFMRDYMEFGSGRVLYICGSMQRCAISDGRAFLPEIHGPDRLTQTPQYGREGVVEREIWIDPNSELAHAVGSSRMLAAKFHHAGVNGDSARPGYYPQTRIVGRGLENGQIGGIVEALELPNGRGFAVQFHPELGKSDEDERLIDYMIAAWREPLKPIQLPGAGLSAATEFASAPGQRAIWCPRVLTSPTSARGTGDSSLH